MNRLAVTGWVVVSCAALVFALVSGNIVLGGALSLAPLAVLSLIIIFRSPTSGLFMTLAWAFIGLGIKRYLPADSGPASALGLGVDIFLLMSWISFFITNFHKPFNTAELKNGLMYWTLAWLIYNVFEILNPDAPTFIGWFYAGRGVAFYMFMTVPLALITIRTIQDANHFILVWFGLSLLGALWGMKQLYIGLDFGELQWLAEPGNRTTHLLFGKLRVFSFYSDSGQFGACMGHAGIVAAILGIQSTGKKRIILIVCSLLFIYGLLISGTRGAMAVPVGGALAFLLIRKNWRLVIIGVAIMALVFGTLKYTSVGSGIYEVQRMRTALDPNNPSLLVRVENQKRLFEYLKSHPFGGGVGSAGYWGLRFSPNSFLANLALDSWYVKIAAEQGFPGLMLFLAFIIFFLVQGYRRIQNTADPEVKGLMMALYAGVAGIALASYGNQVWGQMPTGLILYVSMAIIWNFSGKNISRTESPIDRNHPLV